MADKPTARIRFSLRTKWTLVLLVIGLVPLGALAVATLSIQRRGLLDAEKGFANAVTLRVVDAVDASLLEAAEGTHRVGRLLTESRVSDDGNVALAGEALDRVDVLADVTIYSAEGAYIDRLKRKADVEDHKPLDKAPSPPPGAPADEGFWLAPEFAGGKVLLRYVEPVIRDGQRRAWVIGTVGAARLDQRLRAISADAFDGRADSILLVDDKARLLAGGSFAAGTSLEGRDIFSRVRMDRAAFGKRVLTFTEFSADGIDMAGGVLPMPAHGWAAAVRRPADEVYAALGRARAALGATAAVMALLALAVGWLVAARTTRPVRELVELTQAYGRREFTRRSTVQTGDELEVLGGSMTEMADQLSASEKEIARRAAVEKDLSRYLPGELAKSIAAGEARMALGGERRALSVLFADVVSFTTFAETSPPEQVVAFLNELFTVLTEVLFRHGGTVDKFIGDCVMAVFGAPTPQEDHAARAMAAAEDMQRFVETNQPAWRKKFGIDVKLAIGLNSGEVVVGNLGSEQRMEYTVIGDVVNTAARLESLARPGQVLCTRDTADLVGEEFVLATLGEHPIRGKSKTIEVLELR